MRNVTVARRYARALYQTALDKQTLVDVIQAMGNITHAMDTAPEFNRLLNNPLVKNDLKQKLISTVTSNKLVSKFIDLLTRRKRWDLFPIIYQELSAMVDDAAGVHRALIKTAIPLTDAQKRLIETDVAKRVGGKILGQFELAKDVIGGVWIKMGDKVLDATIKGRIETFRHALVNSTN